jgi:transposase-like protein
MIVAKNTIIQKNGGSGIHRSGTSKASHSDRGVSSSDSEVSAKASRRRFTAEYKLGILTQADFCTEPGSLGALLRREGLYSSNLNTWTRQRDQGVSGLAPKKRGQASARDPLLAENATLRQDIDRLTRRLKQAETIIDVQKKISQILGIQQPKTSEAGETD